MTHNPEDQERPFVTWSSNKCEKTVLYIGILFAIVGIISTFMHLF